MNNFSHGPVDVTSGIFYRPKDSKKTLLKTIFKNILRQLNVSYKDSCCGDSYGDPPFDPSARVTDMIAVSGITMTLTHSPIPSTLDIYVNGALITDYTVTGNTVTFLSLFFMGETVVSKYYF